MFGSVPGSGRVDPLFSPDLLRPDVAGNRGDPAFVRRPLRLGSLLADVHLNHELRYDSNVFNATEHERDAVSVGFEPVVELRSEQPRGVVSLRASARAERMPALPSQDYETYDLAFAARQDMSRSLRFAVSAQAGREVEERGLAGLVLGETRPALLDVVRGRIGLGFQRARWAFDLAGRIERRRYRPLLLADGMSLSQDFRNARTMGGTARLGWSATPFAQFFAEGDYVDLRSPDAAEDDKRDAQGVAVRVGMRIDGRAAGITPLTPAKHLLGTDRLAGQWAVGWRKRNYQARGFRDYDGLVWDATLDWYPTRRVTLRLESGQEFRNSNIPAVASVVLRGATASLFYDVRPRVRIRAAAGYERERYREIDTAAERLTARGELLYALGPRLSARLFASWRQRRSDDARFGAFSGVSSGFSVTGWL